MHYSHSELIEAIGSAGIARGDVVSLQVSLGRIGLPMGMGTEPVVTPPDMTIVANYIINAFLEVITPSGTLIVPTYTYSIGRGDIYEVESTSSAIGNFTEVFRRRAAMRSRDPMLSNCGIGPKSARVLSGIERTCYGKGSTFDYLRQVNAKIVTLGVPLRYATFRHHIEEMAGVPFRFNKKFTGTIRQHGKDNTETWDYFAAPYKSNCQPDGEALAELAIEDGLVGISKIGRGSIYAIKAQDYFDFGMHWLKVEPWLTAVGPPEPSFELFANEPQWLARNFTR
jgi:aminoglycoside 3-N-acetyltransferase